MSVTKYTIKSESSHCMEMFDEINSSKPLCSRLYNIGMRALNNRECGALEACDTLLGISLYGTDSNTTIRWLDVNETRNKRLKSKKEVQLMDPESTDIYYESWVDDHYPNRPEELEQTNLYEFFRWLDIVNVLPKDENVEVYEMNAGKYLKKRKRPHLINHYKYNVNQNPEKYFYALLLMFRPWRTTAQLKDGFETYAESFDAHKTELLEALSYAQKLQDIQAAVDKAKELIEQKRKEFEDAQDQVENCDPENNVAFQAVEAGMAMQDLREITKEVNVEDVGALIGALNADQLRVFEYVRQLMTNSNVTTQTLRHFVSGVGGTGKSYLIKILKAWVKENLSLNTAVAAPTGLSAYNVSGLTIYKLFQLPVEHGRTPKYKCLSDDVLKVMREELKNVGLYIIDEVSMVSNLTFMYIHLRLSEIFDTSNTVNGWFGKKNILVLGDLLQLPPVHEDSPFMKLTTEKVSKHIGGLTAVNLWTKLFTYDELTINMRQSDDKQYADLLNRIRIGIVEPADIKTLQSRTMIFCTETPAERLNEMLEYILKLPSDTVCLFATRNQCAVLNEQMLKRLPSEEIHLVAEDSVDCPPYLRNKVNKELKKFSDNSSRTAGLEAKITVKIGAKIMLLRNIDVALGLVNSAVGQVIAVKRHVDVPSKIVSLTITFSNGQTHDLLPLRTKFEVMDRAFIFRTQFPITLAYGVTIHKSQGMSLKNAVIDVGSSVFSCGQTYVALSRVVNLNGLHLVNFNPSDVKAQQSAIVEYNRLRKLFRPDLCPLLARSTNKNRIHDRTWTKNKTADRVQQDSTDSHRPTSKPNANTLGIHKFSNVDGVSCYSNAVMQCLYNCAKVREIIQAGSAGQVLQNHLSAYDNQECSDNWTIRQSLGGQFLDTQQQDCTEFMVMLLNKFGDIKEPFSFAETYHYHCNNCQQTTTQTQREEIIKNIHLSTDPNDRKMTLESLYYCAQNKWDTLESYDCHHCERRGTARVKSEILSAGQHLIIQLMVYRQDLTKMTNLKLSGVPNSRIEVAGHTYSLQAAIFHEGLTIHSGHYYAYLRHAGNSPWTCANDTKVGPARWPTNSKNIFLLLLNKVQ